MKVYHLFFQTICCVTYQFVQIELLRLIMNCVLASAFAFSSSDPSNGHYMDGHLTVSSLGSKVMLKLTLLYGIDSSTPAS
jgi:hypothetical protein